MSIVPVPDYGATQEGRATERDFDEAMADFTEQVKMLRRTETELAKRFAALDELRKELSSDHALDMRPEFGPLVSGAYAAHKDGPVPWLSNATHH